MVTICDTKGNIANKSRKRERRSMIFFTIGILYAFFLFCTFYILLFNTVTVVLLKPCPLCNQWQIIRARCITPNPRICSWSVAQSRLYHIIVHRGSIVVYRLFLNVAGKSHSNPNLGQTNHMFYGFLMKKRAEVDESRPVYTSPSRNRGDR